MARNTRRPPAPDPLQEVRRSPRTSHFCSRKPGHSRNRSCARWRAPREYPWIAFYWNSGCLAARCLAQPMTRSRGGGGATPGEWPASGEHTPAICAAAQYAQPWPASECSRPLSAGSAAGQQHIIRAVVRGCRDQVGASASEHIILQRCYKAAFTLARLRVVLLHPSSMVSQRCCVRRSRRSLLPKYAQSHLPDSRRSSRRRV